MTPLTFFRSAFAKVFGSPDRTPRKRRLALMQMEGRDMPSVGGGITAGGLLGEYYDNPGLSGSPAFTRRDVRVDFDWGYGSPGGSNSPGFERVGADNFSARWTGQVIPRFSENYTFKAGSDDGVRVWIKPAGTGSWINLVDNWGVHGFEERSRSYPLTAGQTYDIKVEYFESGGPAGARLTWSSPSTPEETIDPVTDIGINALTYADHMFADTTKMSRADWGHPTDYFDKPLVQLDGDGWPMSDASHIFFEGKTRPSRPAPRCGSGKAESEPVGGARFRVNGRDGGRPGGRQPALWSADVIVKMNCCSWRSVRRSGTSGLRRTLDPPKFNLPCPGSVLRTRPRGLRPGDEGRLLPVRAVRFPSANYNAEREWWSGSSRRTRSRTPTGLCGNTSLLANETGKDLYITVPINARRPSATRC